MDDDEDLIQDQTQQEALSEQDTVNAEQQRQLAYKEQSDRARSQANHDAMRKKQRELDNDLDL